MSDDAKWILGLFLPVLLALFGVVWAMLQRRIDRSEIAIKEALGEHRASLAEIEDKLEDLNARYYPMRSELTACDRELTKLREWRHMKGDPYVGALDALKHRVDRIETRMNGHGK